MYMPTVGYVNSFETFGSVDGPGVRFVVFLKGCKLRCRYCHNPETWNGEGERYTSEEVFEKAVRYKGYWGKDGGITVSGGEPLLQIDFLTELFALCKKNGISTVIDTSGEPFCSDKTWIKDFDRLINLTDLVILDLKEFDEKRHIALTGKTNKNIFDMAKYLSDRNKDMWIRHVLVPNLTDSEDSLISLRKFIDSLKSVKKVEILPYHSFGIPKWENLNLSYSLYDTVSPSDEDIKKAEKILVY